MYSPPFRILIVDDALLVVNRITDLVKESKSEVEVMSAHSFAEALKFLEHEPVQLVFLDIHLPDKSGLELLKLLKQRYPDLDIVMLTNHTSGNYRETCERFGASHFLDKSSEFETIPAVLDVYMQKLKKKSDFMPV